MNSKSAPAKQYETSKLPDGWHWAQLSDLVDSSRGICYGIVQPGKHDPNGVPMVNTGEVFDGHVSSTINFSVSKELHEKFKRSTLRGGEILVTLVGANFGRVAIAPPTCKGNNVSRAVGVVPVIEDAEYVMFALRSPLVRHLMNTWANTTAQPTFNLKDLGNLPIPIPPAPVKRAIKETLKALDNRIELLRETNVTLESISQALFKSWFVDFDPVRAKMEGRVPEGIDEATAALFPDRLEVSELGAVPKGWRILPIGDVAEAVGGATPDTKNGGYWEPAIHCWTTPKDLSGIASPVLLDTERKLSDQGLAKVGSGLLPIGTLLLSSRAPIGYLAIAQVPLAINQGYIALKPGGLLPPLYLLHWCRQNMETIKGRANGSTFMEISKKAFRPIPALVPPLDLVQAFTHVAQSLFDRLAESERQVRGLALLRDSLLPRLITGQLRFPDAELEVTAA